MSKEKQDGWFKPRSYRHLDYPQTFDSAKRLACDADAVASHQFLPLIRYVEERRRFRKDNSDRSIPRRKRPTIVSKKQRDIRYSSHSDAAIYQRYAFLIKQPYEDFLAANGLDDAVIGYRSGKGSNVDMAAEAFSEISVRGDVTAICSDITDFFPSISHANLKAGLQRVLEVPSLPSDWYSVYRSLTKFSSLDLKELARIEGFDPKKPPFPLVKNINQAMRRCRQAKAVIRNPKLCEIPQGTALSAVAANISMHQFDEALQSLVVSFGGLYRRYSDDILLLVPPEQEAKATVELTNIANANGLSISPEKTAVARFSLVNGVQKSDQPISYLGFCFDGQTTALRPSTLSRYYRRMTYAARGAARGAGKKGKPATRTFKRALFRDFTHLGRRNFYSYSKRANSKMQNSIIKRQLRKHFKILLRKVEARGK